MSCKRNSDRIVRSVYFWKSAADDISGKELRTLRYHRVKKVYIKFFEVHPNIDYNGIPEAKMRLVLDSNYLAREPIAAGVWKNIEVVPTVFITNEVLKDSIAFDRLAENIGFLVDKYLKERLPILELPVKEIQIDCDWTKSTRDNYFTLLKEVKRVFADKAISCTLRLYPYKYKQSMGIPPVDRAMLMCYNLTGPLETKNSIFDVKEFSAYFHKSNKYPLPLDVALPIFSNSLIFHNKVFSGLYHHDMSKVLREARRIDSLHYEMQKTTYESYYGLLYAGDIIKQETISPYNIEQAIQVLKKHIPIRDSMSVALFHLDHQSLKNFGNEAIKDTYTSYWD